MRSGVSKIAAVRCKSTTRDQSSRINIPVYPMNNSPGTPEERATAVRLTIIAPPTLDGPRDVEQNLPPPSPASLSCAIGTQSFMPPSPATYPSLSPAWEAKDHGELGYDGSMGEPRTADDPPAIRSLAAPTSSSRNTSTPLDRSLPTSAAEQRKALAANLRLDLIPLVSAPQEPVLLPAVAFAPEVGPSPSTASGMSTACTDVPQRAKRAFFGSSDIDPDEAVHSDAASSPMPAAEGPTSSRSMLSGIFELEIGSPIASATGAARGVSSVKDRPTDFEASEGSMVPAAVATSGNLDPSLGSRSIMQSPWGKISPTPESSQSLQGPWGRLQEVRVQIVVLRSNLFSHVDGIPVLFFVSLSRSLFTR